MRDIAELVSAWQVAHDRAALLARAGGRRGDPELDEARKQRDAAAQQLAQQALDSRAALDPAQLGDLIKDLKSALAFGLAREFIAQQRPSITQREPAPEASLLEWLGQQHALCTYKDEELIPRERFQGALGILDLLRKEFANESCETLGLRGAIHKRMWEFSGQEDALYAAARYYLRAWREDATADKHIDKGYGGVNAAYLMDVMASLEQSVVAAQAAPAAGWAAQARALREEMRATLDPTGREPGTEDYWISVTFGEIYWGLEQWERAAAWLARAAANDVSEWELQTTVRQLVSIARLRIVPPPARGASEGSWHPAWRALRALMGEDTLRVLGGHRGKVGLALSGGGFRASLFHLGVLARLAEMDVLRSVEVLSTVSGGSIVGAHYYLALRKLLRESSDGQLGADDYVDLVKQAQGQFLGAIQKNLRTRGLSNLASNLKLLLPGEYTRSNRMGELYEKHIYSLVKDEHAPGERRPLRGLLVHPCMGRNQDGSCVRDTQFNPKFSNWRRQAKVPILLLNTTSLNTGHNWHFTARSMGEPPGLLGPEAETIPRYRRLWYDEAPRPELKSYPLGDAVAASACVPALFEPLELRDLYPGRTVRLVDGGVHDNQGVAGLLDESCTLVLCSDASGKMADNPRPSNSLLGVPLRSNDILMDRVREAQYQDLRSRVDSRALQGLFFIHLKQDLGQDPITWIGGKEKATPERSTRTYYQVDRDLQARLAAIRTDLDSFTEVEAYALMASGYLMTKHEFQRLDREHKTRGGQGSWGHFDVDAPSRGEQYWPFLKLEPVLGLPHDSSDPQRVDLGRQLKVSASVFLKAFRLIPWLGAIGVSALALVVAALAWWVWTRWSTTIGYRTTIGAMTLAVALLAAGAVWKTAGLADPGAFKRSWLLTALVAGVGWVLTNLHLRLVDPLYLKRGKLERLLRLGGG
jgi:predicted acylesterase/phospholipase RssA